MAVGVGWDFEWVLAPNQMDGMPLFVDSRFEEIHGRLREFYGRPPEREAWDPLKQFLYSLLSSRTRTEVTHEVVRELEVGFGSWENLRDASVADSDLLHDRREGD